MTRQEQKQYRALGMKRALDLLQVGMIKLQPHNANLIEEMKRYKWSDSHAAQAVRYSLHAQLNRPLIFGVDFGKPKN